MNCALVTIFVCLLATIAAKTDVNRCSGNKPFPLEVRVVGCTTPPCRVVKGTFMEFEIDFVNDFDTTNLTTLVKATTFGMTVPYELPDDVKDVCSNLMYGAYCPLYPEEDVTYRFLFYISHIYPEIRVNVEIYLVNQDDNIVTCFQCPIRVYKGNTEDVVLVEANGSRA